MPRPAPAPREFEQGSRQPAEAQDPEQRDHGGDDDPGQRHQRQGDAAAAGAERAAQGTELHLRVPGSLESRPVDVVEGFEHLGLQDLVDRPESGHRAP